MIQRVSSRLSSTWARNITSARNIAWSLAMLVALSASTLCPAQSAPLEDLAAFPRTSLEITHREKNHEPQKHRFDIWIADTPTRQEQGLMFVRDLPATQGMLFPLGKPRIANFWMKNTYIELDMIFIAADGHIAKIIERARPFKLDNLSSDQPVGAVLEIKGGEAQRLTLKVGDLITWSKPQI